MLPLVVDLLILAKTFYRTRFVPPGPARGPRKGRPMTVNQAGHPAEGPTAWAYAVRLVKAEHFRPEYGTDVRDAPGDGGIWGNGWLEGDMGGDNRRRAACGDRNPPPRRARDRHLCDQRSCHDALGC